MDFSRRSGLMALAGSTLQYSPRRRGKAAFYYEAVIPPAQARWYRRFGIIVTGGILDPKQADKLRSSGSRLIAYEWMSGFYPDLAPSVARVWHAGLASSKSKLLLNSSPVAGGAASGKAAFWYDFGMPELLRDRADEMAEALRKSGFDGFFFDALGWQHVPSVIQERFHQEHPDVDYEERQGEFLKLVRARLPRNKLIFLNQGYRNPKVYLQHADLDLSESLFTYLRDGGGTAFRPWRNAQTNWDSVRSIMSDIILPAARKFPRVSLVHLNYAGSAASARQAIRYSFACARLFNQNSYVVCPRNPALEEDEIYFEDLGAPVTKSVLENSTGTVAWREFRKGVVALNSGTVAARLPGIDLVLDNPPQGYIFRS